MKIISVDNFNRGKASEFKDRVQLNVDKNNN